MRRALVLVLALFGGCAGLKEAYEKEYVLYDATKPGTAAPGTTPAAGTPEAEFAQLLERERLLAEIERAILDGQDHDGVLAGKRKALESAIAAQRTALGESLGALRRRRVEELRRLEVR